MEFNKTILVTGVSKGLGLEVAKTLLQTGYNVFGLSRSRTRDIESLLTEYPERFNHLQFDLIKTENIRDDIFKKWVGFDRPIHGLVNNAAIAYDDISTNANLGSLEKMFAVNVYSPMILTKYFLRNCLLHNIKGSVIHVSSVSVHTGYKGLSMYAASKGSLEAYSKNVAREWGQKGLRSNCLVAGFMETEMSSTLSDEQTRRIHNRTAMKQGVSIRSVAETIEFLLSDKSSSITGQNIHVDNGTI